MPLFVTSIDPTIQTTLEDRQSHARMLDNSNFHSQNELLGITKWYSERQSFVRLISNAKIETTVVNTQKFISGISLPQTNNTNSSSILSGNNNYANYVGYNSPSQNQVAVPLSPTSNNGTNSSTNTGRTYDSDIRNNWILTGGIEYKGQMPSGFGQLYSSDRNVPLPGITEVSVQNKGAFGSTREAKIKYVCHTIEQLEMLEMLYMTFGVFCVLEWGWSLLPDGTLNNEKITLDDIKQGLTVVEKLIPEKVKNSKGHYDAMMGKVTGFNWSSREGGGYDCETTLISMAGAFLSMDTKSSTRGFGIDDKSEQYLEPISNIDQAILDLENIIKKVEAGEAAFFNDNGIKIPIGIKRNQNFDKGDSDQLYVTWGIIEDYILTHSLGMVSPNYKHDLSNQDVLKHYISILYEKNNMPTGSYTYDQLYEIRESKEINAHIGAVKSPEKINGIFPQFNSYNTKIFNDPNIYSADPAICVLPGQSAVKIVHNSTTNTSFALTNPGNDEYSIQGKISAEMNKFVNPDNIKQGYVRNICVNLNFIKETYKNTNTVDEFVISLLNEINSACGEPWKFGTFNDHRLSNTIMVVDLGAWSETEPLPVIISINGLDSIVRSATLNTEVDPKMTSQIMYCTNKDSSASGTSSKVEGFGFWGRNVVDQNFESTKPVDTDIISVDPPRQLVKNDINGLIDTLNITKKAVMDERSDVTVAAAKQALHNYLVRTAGGIIDSDNKESTSFTTMLPVKLAITIDGLSGLIFGNALRAKPIPQRYKDCWFTITNVSHALTGNDWTTSIETVLRVRLNKDNSTTANTVSNPNYANTTTPTISNGNEIQRFRQGDTSDIEGKFKNPTEGHITSKIQQNRTLTIKGVTKTGSHRGIDIASSPKPEGNKIVASYDGIVDKVKPLNGGAGNYVRIKHAIKNKAYYTHYHHLMNNSFKVKEGDVVYGGKTIIGNVGNTGDSTGPHLHFAITDIPNEYACNMKNGYVYDPLVVIEKGTIGKAV